MGNVARLSADQRKQAIVDAVRDVFAEKGFDGTTTRELAQAAGVSEALIYKHFPSKESLYAAMLDACAKGPTFAQFKRILALEPSTSTLVLMVYFTISHYVLQRPGDPNKAALNCLLVRSLLEDGALVRLTHKRFASAWVAKFEACVKEAVKTGDIGATPIRRDLRVWFVHHIAFSLMLHLRPKVPAIDYNVSRDALVEQATWFALRGVGFAEEAIKRHYNPKALSLLGD
ncbi:MAG TPA: helix-turn-helix domain-containing protein [Candidatus Binatia bacterium]